MVKKVVFRVRRKYFDAIVAGIKTVELRAFKSFWQKRLCCTDSPEIAIFICGKDVHKRKIIGISVDRPEIYLNRPLSAQGIKDIPTSLCIGTHLGEVIE